MSRYITAKEVVKIMPDITDSINDYIFLLEDIGALVIHSRNDGGNQADACAKLVYELIEEDEIEEFKKELLG